MITVIYTRAPSAITDFKDSKNRDFYIEGSNKPEKYLTQACQVTPSYVRPTEKPQRAQDNR